MELIGAGFGRTGTLSLKVALEQLGWGPCYHMVEVFNQEKNPDHLERWYQLSLGGSMDWETLYRDYRSAVDFPTAGCYAELIQVFPHAKVILTLRDPIRWHQSVMETIYLSGKVIGEQNPKFKEMVDNLIWKKIFDDRIEDQSFAIEVFTRYNETVKATVPADRLLVYEVKQGWDPLCQFLGVDPPEHPFPHVNDTAEFKLRLADLQSGAAHPH